MRPAATILAALAAATAQLAAALPSQAATLAVTTQAQAANAAFLAYAPPPPNGPGALCLVDTGVSSNPDTQPGLVSATAVDGGPGADVDPNGHGTTMAMIAGAAGNGMIGAWPQIKIVSVRATTAPSPGQEPSFEFDNYTQGMAQCIQQAGRQIRAIDLALSSSIPPTPDQAQGFADKVAQARGQGIAVVAAAGNLPGPVAEPASEPGVLAVGAGDANNGLCSFSATQALTFYAPGCGLTMADPFTDRPTCCGNGTSQASAFVAAILVALMSYDPGLTYSKAERLLVSTAANGHLDAAAAFQADNLSPIVEAGSANIPKASAPTPPTPTQPPTKSPGISFAVREARWSKARLTLIVSSLGKADRLSIELRYPNHPRRKITSQHARTVVRTRRPSSVILRVYTGQRLTSGPLTVRVT